MNRAYDADELLPATLEYAKDMAANCSPRSLAVIKSQLNADWTRSVEETRTESLSLVREMIGKDDFNEGVKSYLEKRTPRYKGLSHDPDSAEPLRPF